MKFHLCYIPLLCCCISTVLATEIKELPSTVESFKRFQQIIQQERSGELQRLELRCSQATEKGDIVQEKSLLNAMAEKDGHHLAAAVAFLNYCAILKQEERKEEVVDAARRGIDLIARACEQHAYDPSLVYVGDLLHQFNQRLGSVSPDDYQKEIKILEQLAKTNPPIRDMVLWYRVPIECDAGHFQAAQKLCEEIDRLASALPTREKGRSNTAELRAEILYRQGKIREAIEILQQASAQLRRDQEIGAASSWMDTDRWTRQIEIYEAELRGVEYAPGAQKSASSPSSRSANLKK